MQEAEAKRLREDGEGGGEDSEGEESDSREGLQHAMQEGLLTSHGLEFDKQWTRMLRVIKSQVRCSPTDCGTAVAQQADVQSPRGIRQRRQRATSTSE